MTERLKYFRSQLISSDPSTMCYWSERHDGETFDIHHSAIPELAHVIDVSGRKKDIIYQKQEGRFVRLYGEDK